MKKRGNFLLAWVIVVLFGFFIVLLLNNSLVGNLIYDASYTNVSEHNTSSSVGFVHINASDSNLKLYLPFNMNNSLSKVFDHSRYSNDANLVSSPEFVSNGYDGGAYNFSGGYEHIEVPYDVTLGIGGDLTLSAWVNLGNSTIDSVSIGGYHSCVLFPDGSPLCWGDNEYGQLGDEDDGTDKTIPVFVSGNYNFSEVSLGDYFSCGVLQNGSAMCWGRNDKGQLGNGSTGGEVDFPIFVTGNHNFSKIFLGADHACGILTNGSSLCWGDNGEGQLGNGSIGGTSDVPLFVSGNHNFTSLAPSNLRHTCGLLTNGSAMCWGGDNSGQLGCGGCGSQSTPVMVLGGHNFSTISAGNNHNCALLINSSAMCWGANAAKQLGDDTSTARNVPTYVYGDYNYSVISAGNSHSCGILTNGSGKCWGGGTDGQLGNGDTINKDRPADISGGYNFSDISLGYAHTCGFLTDGMFKCWGLGSSGQIGDGLTLERSTPTDVIRGQILGKKIEAFSIYSYFDNEIFSYIESNNVTSNTSLNSGWNHIALVYNTSGNHSLYLNNQLVGITSNSGSYAPAGDQIKIMENTPGIIDDVMVFNRALNQTEIEQIYNLSYPMYYSHGELLFNKSLSGNRLAISMDECSTLNSTSLQVKVNDGSYQSITSCEASGLTINSGYNDITIRLNSNSNKTHTPWIKGSINFTASTVSTSTENTEDTGDSTSSGGILTSEETSEETIIVKEALSDDYWEKTSSLDTSSSSSSSDLTLNEALTQEQEVLNALQSGEDTNIQEIYSIAYNTSITEKEKIFLDVKNKSYEVGVAKINDDGSIILQVGSGENATQVLLGAGNVSEFDLNKDSLTDLRVNYKLLSPTKQAEIVMEVTYHGLVADEEIEDIEYQEKSKKFFFFLVGAIAILGVIFAVDRFRKFNA